MERYLKCADYRRVSSKRQVNTNNDKMQEHSNLALIKRLIEEENAQYIGTYKDSAKSAFHTRIGEREGMQELIKDVEAGKVNCIVFYDESRITRNFVDFEPEFVEPLLRANPHITFYKSRTGMPWDPYSENALSDAIDAVLDARRRSDVARDSQSTDISNNRRPGGKLPFGIKGIAGTQLVPNSDLPIVVLIFELAAWGYSERAIANYLTELGVKSPVERNDEWCHTSVRHILSNRMYVGIGEWNKRPNRRPNSNTDDVQLDLFGSFQPLIPDYLWDMAHSQIDQRSKGLITRSDTPFLLTDIIECGHCGIKLKGKNSLKQLGPESSQKNGAVDYHCPQCKSKWNVADVHSEVIDHLMGHVNDYFSREKIESKIDIWKKEIQKDIAKQEEDLEWMESNCRRLLRESVSFDKKTQDALSDHMQSAIDHEKQQIRSYSEVLDELDIAFDIADFLSEKVQEFSQLYSRVEQRHILLSAIERVVAKIDGRTRKVLVEIEYKCIPLPKAL